MASGGKRTEQPLETNNEVGALHHASRRSSKIYQTHKTAHVVHTQEEISFYLESIEMIELAEKKVKTYFFKDLNEDMSIKTKWTLSRGWKVIKEPNGN